MRKVIRRAACSSYARVAGYGFIVRERLWCTELDRWVDADDGRAFGERGELKAGVVPRLREEGVEPVLADVDLRPCAARDRHVDCLPTIIADDRDDELLRCRGHPTKGQPSVLWSSPQVEVVREGGPTRASKT